MASTTLSTTAAAVALAAASLALAGCGRYGQLDTPYEAAVEARKDAQQNQGQPVPPEPAKPAKDKPFILDGLIK